MKLALDNVDVRYGDTEHLDDIFKKALYTNRCSLYPQDLVIPGFKVKEYSVENGELNIAVRK